MCKNFLAVTLALLVGFTLYRGEWIEKNISTRNDLPNAVVTQQTPAPTPVPTQKPAQAPVNDPKPAGVGLVDHINKYTVINLYDNIYYDFRDHNYISKGLDGSVLNFDVYYGIDVRVDGLQVKLSWHNYTNNDVYPVSISSSNLNTNTTSKVCDWSKEVHTLNGTGMSNGAYTIEVTLSNDETLAAYFYRNGDQLYACQQAEESKEHILYWTDRKRYVDNLMSNHSLEEFLDASDNYWAYPCPAEYNQNKYRCDNDLWIGLAHELADGCETDAQKAVVIHDWLTANLAYDYYKVNVIHKTRPNYYNDRSGKHNMWNTHVGVCADFTSVYSIMLRSVGIPATSLAENDDHVWNLVHLDGRWIEIDLTEDINRKCYGEDVTQIVLPNETICYASFGNPFDSTVLKPETNRLGYGMYTHSFVTGKSDH